MCWHILTYMLTHLVVFLVGPYIYIYMYIYIFACAANQPIMLFQFLFFHITSSVPVIGWFRSAPWLLLLVDVCWLAKEPGDPREIGLVKILVDLWSDLMFVDLWSPHVFILDRLSGWWFGIWWLIVMVDSGFHRLQTNNGNMMVIWLVVWNMFYFPYMGKNTPIWLICFRGVGQPPTGYDFRWFSYGFLRYTVVAI